MTSSAAGPHQNFLGVDRRLHNSCTDNSAVAEIGRAADLARIDDLDTGIRGGPEPDTITLEVYGRAIPEA